jgi:peptide deformylase
MTSQRLFVSRRLAVTTFHSRSLHKEPTSFFDFLLSPKRFAPKPPFDHIVQIGDPVLRAKTQEVNLDRLASPQIKFLLRTLKKSLDNYDAVGVSAPQLGVPLKIFAVQITERQISGWSPEIIRQRGLVPIPCRFFINPQLKIVNSELVPDREGCCSVYGYSGLVSRAREVEVRAFDENGQPVTWLVKDWTARVVQHEMDHLKGSFFPKTRPDGNQCFIGKQ